MCINVSVNFSNCDNKEGSMFEQTVCVFHCFLDFVTTKKSISPDFDQEDQIKSLQIEKKKTKKLRNMTVKTKFRSKAFLFCLLEFWLNLHESNFYKFMI